MKQFKKATAIALAMLMLSWCLLKSPVVLADQLLLAKAKITEHEPQGRHSTEIEAAPAEGTPWLWVILGVLGIGGLVAAAGGGGSSGDDDDDDGGGPITGSFETSW